ncbi:MAG: TetR/AcrR family transcriptional regulator [Halobacteriaceae archaeon]
MSGQDSTDEETHDAVMDAVRDALCNHGPTDLTMQDIAAEADRSSAALHYHYDTKQDLLIAFLRHLRTHVEEQLASLDSHPPRERLDLLMDHLLVEAPEPEEERLFTALAALRTQAPYVAPYREEMVRTEETLRQFVTSAIRDGNEAGAFDCEAPEQTARLLLAAMRGARSNRVLLDDEGEAVVRGAIESHVIDAMTDDDGTGQ